MSTRHHRNRVFAFAAWLIVLGGYFFFLRQANLTLEESVSQIALRLTHRFYGPVLATFVIRAVSSKKSGSINVKIDVAAFFSANLLVSVIELSPFGTFSNRSGRRKTPGFNSQAHFLVTPSV